MTSTTQRDSGIRVAVDTGGTFTDIAVSQPDGTVGIWKVSSTPARPDDAVHGGVELAIGDLRTHWGAVERFVHGTTVATNALITRTGARVALVTTDGFGDLLAIGRQTRPNLYDASVANPRPLVGEGLVWEVAERIDADGKVRIDLDIEAVREAAEQIAAADVDVVVVSLLNAYVDSSHEQQIVNELRDRGVAPSIFGATDISPEMREYDRTSTAVVNGYLQPKISGYVRRLEQRLADEGMPARLWIMQSNGGLLSASAAQSQSVRTVLSGLAGGVVGAARWATMLDLDRVVSFDIGGTSTDIALIRNGQPVEMSSSELEGFPLLMPTVDVHTIGAGGGSIAWQDAGGGLRVGPHSAGADPGPVCYGRGGRELAVTDAHAALGRLGDTLLDGALVLDLDSMRERLAEFASTLGLDDAETAAGILRVINASMARGVRRVSVERGVDLRSCTLLAFGGAGPLHAADMVRELGMKGAVIPPHPGVASAIGMLDAPVRHDLVTAVTATDQDQLSVVARALEVLTAEARAALEDEQLDGDRIEVVAAVDARYFGQSYELKIPWADSFDSLRATFDATHAERYGFSDEAATLEVVAARVTATVAQPARENRLIESSTTAPEPVATRDVFFEGTWHATPIYRRASLPAGLQLRGPAIVEQLDSTTVVAPGQTFEHDQYGFLHINEETS